jgi:hypothetical protein
MRSAFRGKQVLVIALDPARLKARPFPADPRSTMIRTRRTRGIGPVQIARMAALAAALAFLTTGCGGPPPLPTQASPADLARQALVPIQISPAVAGIYRVKYLAALDGATSGIFAISPNGNRFEFRTCRHPDCQMSDDEIAARALDRCDLGFARKHPEQRCLVFDRNGKIAQPYRFWSDADFAMPVPAPVALNLTDTTALVGRYAAMTPDGQLVINLRPDGSAYFWDTGDYFHQGTWSLKAGAFCVLSVDQRTMMTCGALYGADPQHVSGTSLDLFPGRFLPVTRLTSQPE